MPKPSRRLKQLEQELLALGGDAMLTEELDGFIAGLLVCPELIPGSRPPVWPSAEQEEALVASFLCHLDVPPSWVPIVSALFIMNFMLLVPLAS